MDINVTNQDELSKVGERLGSTLKGGEVIELVGDVGAGKTTFTKAIARGMAITDDVDSPSYTLSQTYEAPDGLRLIHYDFYRLHQAGIMAMELEEALLDQRAVIVVEWGDIIAGILPTDHLQIHLTPLKKETARQLSFSAGGDKSRQLMERLK